MKRTNDYDSTFKTMKHSHKRLFISVINEVFGKDYPISSDIIEVLPAEGFLTFGNPDSSDKEIRERDSDFLIRIRDDYYLIESQVYDDDTMALRIAEYTFLAARQYADVSQAEITLNIPHFTVLYIKATANTPRTTTIRYNLPNGETFKITEKNMFLSDYTLEEIISKKLYPLIPFYFARYEKELKSEKNYENPLAELEFLNKKMLELIVSRDLSIAEYTDLKESIIRVLKHITDGNKIESEVIQTMGGEIYETVSERIIREATEPLKAELADKDAEIADQKTQIADQKTQIADQKTQIADQKAQLENRDAEIADQKSQIIKMQEEIARLKALCPTTT